MKKRIGFTLIEILIGTTIFCLFMGAVFGFYRMGAKMFNSGTWKQNTQKQAELFLAKLRERVYRTSAPIIINGKSMDNDGIKAYLYYN